MSEGAEGHAASGDDAAPKEVALFLGGSVTVEKWFQTVDDALAFARTNEAGRRAFIVHLRSQSQPERSLARSLRHASADGKPLLGFASADSDGIPMSGGAVDAANVLRIGLVTGTYPVPEDSRCASLSVGEHVALENEHGTTYRGAFIERRDGGIVLELDGSANDSDPPFPADDYSRLYRLGR